MRKRAFEAQAVQLPKLCINGKMSDLTVSLTPYTYCNFTQIHKLFYGSQQVSADTSTAAGEAIEKNPLSLFKLSNKATIKGYVNKQGHTQNIDETYYTLLYQDKLLFYSASDDKEVAEPLQKVSLDAEILTSEERHEDTGADEEEDKVNEAIDKLFFERGYLI